MYLLNKLSALLPAGHFYFMRHLPIHQKTANFAIMKQEMYYGKIYYSFDELKTAIDSYIKYYNKERIKERLGWKSPVQYRLAKAT